MDNPDRLPRLAALLGDRPFYLGLFVPPAVCGLAAAIRQALEATRASNPL